MRLTDEGASLPAEVFANLGAQRPTARARAPVECLTAELAAHASSRLGSPERLGSRSGSP